jgi:hypothetical protein
MIRFEPSGTKFMVPVKLTFSLQDTEVSGRGALIGYWTGEKWFPLPTFSGAPDQIWTELEHFSEYGTIPCMPVADDSQEGCREPAPDYCAGGTCPGIWVNGWTYSQCVGASHYWSADFDEDLTDDYCETDLAYAFRPLMKPTVDCSWDAPLNRSGGEYFYAVQWVGNYTVRIVYMPAYYYDCGHPTWGGSHTGDSEFVAFDVEFDWSSNRWFLVRGFLSAHCGAAFLFWDLSSRCRWYTPNYFVWAGNNGGAVVVHVSEGKNANYPTVGLCNEPLIDTFFRVYQDHCTLNGPEYRFPIPTLGGGSQNVGSRNRPLINLTGPLSTSQKPAAGVLERIWATPPTGLSYESCVANLGRESCRFNGWLAHVHGEPAPPYGRLLLTYLGL